MNDADITQTAELLKQLEPGFLPLPIFEQVARLLALPIVEWIPLRMVAGKVEVLLIERPADDYMFAGMLHTPGTVVRATDLTEDDSHQVAFDRLTHEELEGTDIGHPVSVGSIFHGSKRGVEQAQVYYVEVFGEPKVGAFYPVDDLPASFIDSQRRFVLDAARKFQSDKA